MVMRSLLCFWTLFFNVITAEFQPKVTRTETDAPARLTIFDNSTTLLKVQGESLFISSDNGVNWEKSDELYGDIWRVKLDEHYRNSRAVVVVDYEWYLTEDQGRHWRKLNLPKFTGGYCELDTHPFEKDYLLARCVTYTTDKDFRDDSYVSNDAGRSFRKIESPDTEDWGSWVTCTFACESRDSVFCSNKDLVYCFDRGIHRRHVFYTDDFGKSVNFVDQFKDHTVSSFQILDSHILVVTVEHESADLWVSNDGFTFNKAFLPAGLRDPDIWRIIEDVSGSIIEDGLGRIIITTDSFGMNEEQEPPIFISDSLGLQFQFLEFTTENALASAYLMASKTSKGTMWAHLRSVIAQHTDSYEFSSHSKISSDYGDTWSNLRVIRSPDQRKDLFPCDVDDVENCSLELSPFFYRECSQAAGILMTVGVVGKDLPPYDKLMTFISRDGGRSWEVALEYPCLHAFGDGGNIIVAIPISPFGDNVPKGEFYYSLDQGRTWKKHQLEGLISSWKIISMTTDSSGLNFIISASEIDFDRKMSGGLVYTIDFTGVFNGRVCGPEDFEHWYQAGGECLNGAKYSYSRRKQGSQCLVRKTFDDLSPREEACDQCTRKDYECSFGFIEDIHGTCKPYPEAIAYSSECKDPNKTSVKLKPMNKLPGNKCVKEVEIEPVEVPCDIARQISTAENKFKSKIQLYQYFDAKKDDSKDDSFDSFQR